MIKLTETGRQVWHFFPGEGPLLTGLFAQKYIQLRLQQE